jgi:hypothetical protein
MQTAKWARMIDRLVIVSFAARRCRVLQSIDRFEETDPRPTSTVQQRHLLAAGINTPQDRSLAATARLKQIPFLMEQGKRNLIKPVRHHSQLAMIQRVRLTAFLPAPAC